MNQPIPAPSAPQPPTLEEAVADLERMRRQLARAWQDGYAAGRDDRSPFTAVNPYGSVS